VARAAVAGIARHELIHEAVHFLVAHAKADRVGVWMESADSEHLPGRGFVEFRGIVADRDGEATPPEWERLSPEAPLPMELLNAGKSVEQDLGGARNHIILGALVEIKRALWVPVESRGRLRGVLLAGSHKKHGALPLPLLESVAAELALVLERDEYCRSAQQRQADITVTSAFSMNWSAPARVMQSWRTWWKAAPTAASRARGSAQRLRCCARTLMPPGYPVPRRAPG
jgi:hypothetical protein